MLRSPHQSVRQGRSAGEAERRRVTGPARTSVLLVATFVALACFPSWAGAQSTQEKIDATRAAIDANASEWLDRTQDASVLDDEIAQLAQRIDADRDHAARVAVIARGRAVEVYTGGNGDLAGVLDASSALDSARRAELLDRANADGQAAIDQLGAMVEDLAAKREELAAQQAEQVALQAELERRRAELDTQLTTLTKQAAAEAETARAAAAARARRPSQSQPAARAPSAATPRPTVAAAPTRNGSSSHHDDPFLVCTRARESGGNYSIVSGSGLYYGAYQFLPTTWNVTANHAGRNDLVGVLPSRAAPADQDDLAWALYQWQGNQPWGGRC